jgi:hypothetical protein
VVFTSTSEAVTSLAGIILVAGSFLLGTSGATSRAGYAWPVKPFDRPHPIRSTFGDPRTLFRGPPTRAVLHHGAGIFSFHTGVDIAAPDGSPVYPVESGTVVSTAGCKVIVRSRGATFQYWHIFPAVSKGQVVTAFTTVLGRIRTTYGHVHFVELHDGHPTNPLAPGHLTPYQDTTTPIVGRIEFRRPGGEDELMPELLRGVVEVDVPVSDMPKPAAPGEWKSMPTAPALVRWRVERARDGQVALPDRTPFDMRTSLPTRPFWTVYARGTRQNDPTFLKHRYWRQEGWFLIRLGILDTRALKDGIYRVVVTAHDIRGNAGLAHATFLVYNHRLWPPATNQA